MTRKRCGGGKINPPPPTPIIIFHNFYSAAPCTLPCRPALFAGFLATSRVHIRSSREGGLGASMQPSDIHFAAVWPTSHDGTARKVRHLTRVLVALSFPNSNVCRTASLLQRTSPCSSAHRLLCTPLRTDLGVVLRLPAAGGCAIPMFFGGRDEGRRLFGGPAEAQLCPSRRNRDRDVSTR